MKEDVEIRPRILLLVLESYFRAEPGLTSDHLYFVIIKSRLDTHGGFQSRFRTKWRRSTGSLVRRMLIWTLLWTRRWRTRRRHRRSLRRRSGRSHRSWRRHSALHIRRSGRRSLLRSRRRNRNWLLSNHLPDFD